MPDYKRGADLVRICSMWELLDVGLELTRYCLDFQPLDQKLQPQVF